MNVFFNSSLDYKKTELRRYFFKGIIKNILWRYVIIFTSFLAVVLKFSLGLFFFEIFYLLTVFFQFELTKLEIKTFLAVTFFQYVCCRCCCYTFLLRFPVCYDLNVGNASRRLKMYCEKFILI